MPWAFERRSRNSEITITIINIQNQKYIGQAIIVLRFSASFFQLVVRGPRDIMSKIYGKGQQERSETIGYID